MKEKLINVINEQITILRNNTKYWNEYNIPKSKECENIANYLEKEFLPIIKKVLWNKSENLLNKILNAKQEFKNYKDYILLECKECNKNTEIYLFNDYIDTDDNLSIFICNCYD